MDLSMKTAEVGYLTRRIVEAVQEVIIKEIYCETKKGIFIEEEILEKLLPKVYGRYLLKEIKNNNDEIIFTANCLIGEEELQVFKKQDIHSA